MKDNSIMQRAIYKYETTLADFDSVLNGGHKSNEIVIELKRIAEKQLKEIISL